MAFLLIVLYITFISLGLPDAALGASWPSMFTSLGVKLSYAGIVSMIATSGTIVSSFLSVKLIRKFNTGIVTAVSIALTATALILISFTTAFWQLCIIVIFLGLGAGTIDSALNNFVALHYKSKHMNWLHSFWGIGATLGPYIMGLALSAGLLWNEGYRILGFVQLGIFIIVLTALPLFKKKSEEKSEQSNNFAALSLKDMLKLKGAVAAFFSFFAYCAVEATTGLWASSYLVFAKGMSKESAAKWTALFFLGITAGRILSGFVSDKLGNKKIVRIGYAVMALGILIILLPFGITPSLVGLMIIGLGSAPIFPGLIHETPKSFGVKNSQAIVGMQVGAAYIGITTMSPLFGLLAAQTSLNILPYYLLVFLAVMILMIERLNRLGLGGDAL